MQEVLMAVSTVPRRSSQLGVFSRPQGNRHGTDLTSDVQQKMGRLLAQLLRQHRGAAEARKAEEAQGGGKNPTASLGTEGGFLRAPILGVSGSEQLRESETAVCHAGSIVQPRLARHRSGR